MSIDDINNAVDKYSNIFDTILVAPHIFFIMMAELIVAYIVRFILIMSEHKNTSKRKKREVCIYAIEHLSIEAIIALVISYLVIKLTNANVESYIINYAVSPISGFILAIIIDNRVFIKDASENKSINRFFNKLSGSKKSAESSSSNGVSVVINNGGNTSTPTPAETNPTELKLKNITSEELEAADDPNEVFKDAINDLNNCHIALQEELSQQSEILVAMRDTMMTEKRFEIKDLIYTCLDQGYATPEQNETVEATYNNYIALKGNGEVKKLYEEKYSQLEIHYDRHVKDVPVEVERRRQNKSTRLKSH